MKRIFKKNQVIITALAIMIAVAGYLNFSDTDFGFGSKEASTDSSGTIVEDIDSLDYDISDETALLEENAATTVTDSTSDSEDAQETATDIPGEAVLTGASTFAAQAKVSREQVRSQNREELQSIIDNPDISEEQKQQAVATMVDMTEKAEKEAAAELLLAAKGFENSVVNLTGDSADVVVPMEEIPDDKRAQIEDIVKRKTDIAPENIVITSLNQAAEEE
ncbi:MAG: SpoIIIAH-like family protein [Lachnospiraceae bacterium]|nr:SpoIIIAH-like family protein [Lachnospiraceae bacterium]MDD6618232.1 SpoIIIAH-like family protein [Clostridiales bacterium]MDY4771405.1 SpoIIIAH-like family protein [Lachnospiraceae bacterium]